MSVGFTSLSSFAATDKISNAEDKYAFGTSTNLSTDLGGIVVRAIDGSSKPLRGAATAEPMRNQIFQQRERVLAQCRNLSLTGNFVGPQDL